MYRVTCEIQSLINEDVALVRIETLLGPRSFRVYREQLDEQPSRLKCMMLRAKDGECRIEIRSAYPSRPHVHLIVKETLVSSLRQPALTT